MLVEDGACTKDVVWSSPGPPPDREYLENVILPELSREGKYMLFVGVADYTSNYSCLVGDNVRFVTTDANLDKDEHGKPEFTFNFSSEKFPVEITKALQDKGENFHSFDSIILNGVIGWGTNTEGDIVKMLSNCQALLRPGGKVLLGWNSPEFSTHMDISDDQVLALAQQSNFSLCTIEGEKIFTGHTNNKWTPEKHSGYQFHRYALLEKRYDLSQHRRSNS